MSKAQKKKAAKKAKKLASGSFCWYCEREFEDDKILLSHQKAKHFRCPHCPRRLNTAGGLAVHIDQVHKTEPTRLENTLPGRDSFDIEIYGMEGIPKEDLLAWRRKKDAELGITDSAATAAPQAKRPRIFKGVIPIDDLAKQLAIHRQVLRNANAAMSNANLRPPGGPPGAQMGPPGAGAGASPMPLFPPGVQVPGVPGAGPPVPPFALPGGVPMPPPGMFPLPPNMMPMPPPGFPMAPGASPFPQRPGMPPQPFHPSQLQPGASPMPMPGQQQPYPGSPAPVVHLQPYTAPSSRTELKSGQVMVYGDNEVSIEEKRAKNPKYALTIPTSAQAAPPSAITPASATNAAAAPVQSAPAPAPAPAAASASDASSQQIAGQKRARATDFL